MSVVIIQSKNEAMAKRFFELNVVGNVEFIREPNDWFKILVSQNSLFVEKRKAVFCFVNMLDKKFTKELANLEKQEDDHKLYFIQFSKGRSYLPKWLKDKAKIYDLDQLSRGFSFWEKVAAKMGVKIDYDEWQKAVTILGGRINLLFSVLEQKKIAPKYKLDFFVANWTEGNIFKLIDAIDQKNASSALKILYSFWQRDEDPGLIWNMLVRHFVQLKQVKEGASIQIHPYALMQAKKALINYKDEEIEQILELLLKLDVKSKTGYLESARKGYELIYLLLFSLLFSQASGLQPIFWQPEI